MWAPQVEIGVHWQRWGRGIKPVRASNKVNATLNNNSSQCGEGVGTHQQESYHAKMDSEVTTNFERESLFRHYIG